MGLQNWGRGTETTQSVSGKNLALGPMDSQENIPIWARSTLWGTNMTRGRESVISIVQLFITCLIHGRISVQGL